LNKKNQAFECRNCTFIPTNLNQIMQHILKVLAVIVVITYSLRLVNAQSDWLVFSGIAVILLSLYFLFHELDQILEQLKSKQ
jgi:uncharacterized membrane protein YgdD (TMEM256/DUF423 family)